MKPLLLVLTLSLTLGACTFYVSPRPGASVTVRPLPSASAPDIVVTETAVVTDFAPTRGEGSVYALGESISFRLRTTGSGYVTLTATGPDGSSSVFAQNVYVAGGADTTLPTPQERVTYTLTPPRGLQRVTLAFSSTSGGIGDTTAETSFYIQ